MKKFSFLLAMLTFVSVVNAKEIAIDGALEHSGGTDRYGCHVDSRTGIRHCH